MNNNVLYQDKLIEISDASVLLKNYYYPSLKPKEIAFSSIESIIVKQPSIWTGKWRLHGTGNFRTWFPLDNARNKRDKIFFMTLKEKWVRIGFTAENSEPVEKIFREKGLTQAL